MDFSNHDLPKEIGKPAIRALLTEGITNLEQVKLISDQELLMLHGIGQKAVRILRENIHNNF